MRPRTSLCTVEEIRDQAMVMPQHRGHLTYNTLKRQLQLNDSALEGLKNEFIYGQVWYTGGVSRQALASR